MKRWMVWLLIALLVVNAVPCFAETGAFPVAVTDAAGREVTLAEKPQRIVSGYYISTSMLLALGLEESIVGIEAKADTRDIYRLAAPELIDLPCVGTAKQIDTELVLLLEPDLVILPMKQLETAQTLSDMGIAAMVVDPENYEDLLTTMRLIADATGTDASDFTDYYTETENKLAERLANVEKPKVYISGNSAFLKTAGSAMYQNTLLTMAGGVNAASELSDAYWADVSYEQLLAWEPDAIVMAADAAYTREDVLNDAVLQDLSCVRDGRVYAMPSSPEAWDSPVPAAILGSLWIASRLHPEVYPYEAFVQDAADFYARFYGMEPEDVNACIAAEDAEQE